MRRPLAREIDLEGGAECGAVIALTVRVVEVRVPIPAGMIGIEFLGARRQREATLRVSRIGEHLTNESDGVTVHRVECNSPLCRISEALEFLIKIERLGQTKVAQMIGRRDLDGMSRGR